MAKALGATFLSNSREREFQRANNFEVVFDGLADNVTLNVVSFPLPALGNEVLEVAHGNSKVKFAGVATLEDGDLTIRDSVGLDTEKAIQEWRDKVYNPVTDAIGFAADYKKNGTVYQYSPDGTVERKWSIVGAWPSRFTPGELNNDSNEVKNMTVTISYDKAYLVR